MTLDLSKQVPRSPFDTLEGFAWLPRLIDKARAGYAGTLGDYRPYPCPGDKRFLSYFGLDPGALGALIESGATDTEIAAYVRRTTKRTPEELIAFQHHLEHPPEKLLLRGVLWIVIQLKLRDLRAGHPDVDFSKIDTPPKALAFEEGHPVPGL